MPALPFLIVGVLLCLIAFVWSSIAAFRESVWWLLACWCVPFASLVFLVKHWSVAKGPFFLRLVGLAVMVPPFVVAWRDQSAALAAANAPLTEPAEGATKPIAAAGPAAFLRAALTSPVTSGTLALELQGAGVGRFQGERWQPLPAGALAGKRHFAFYYSAHWCPPCRAFTPKLLEFYRGFAASHPDFELVFVSSDHNEAEMQAYMQETGMPWPAVPYGKTRSTRLPRSTGSGIPCLILADANGRVLSDSFAGSNYLGPQKVLNDIAKLPAGGGGAADSPLLAAAASPATPGELSASLRRETAVAEAAERRAARQAVFDKHLAEANALFKDLNARRAKLKVDDAKAVAAFNTDAARYASLLAQAKTDRDALDSGSAAPAAPAAATPPPPPVAKADPINVPGGAVNGGDPARPKPPAATPPGEQPGLYRRSLDAAARTAREASSRGEETTR